MYVVSLDNIDILEEMQGAKVTSVSTPFGDN